MNAKLLAEIAAGLAAVREVFGTIEAALSLAKQVNNAEDVTDEQLSELRSKREAALDRLRTLNR